MKVRLRFRVGDGARALWFLAAIILGLGAYLIETRYQSAIVQAHARTESLYRETVANRRIIAQASALRRIQNVVGNDLRHVSQEQSISMTTAALLLTLQRSALQHRIVILGVEPGRSGDTDTRLPQTDLMLRVEGGFRDILGFVEDLPHHRTLISVTDTQLSLAQGSNDAAGAPKLDATIRAVLYRLRLPAEEVAHVAAP